MRALQATLIQFDHNCPQYSVIDVATTKTSSCDVVLVPCSAATASTPLEKQELTTITTYHICLFQFKHIEHCTFSKLNNRVFHQSLRLL